ncbi:LCP family protein [Streptacidiphilus sp. MAP12-20]|uniref:LCP family protein n=1 Tax=Streptacidiphilus sp. MAP12-20 TaxID=3156299 RepID=UPI003512E1E6
MSDQSDPGGFHNWETHTSPVGGTPSGEPPLPPELNPRGGASARPRLRPGRAASSPAPAPASVPGGPSVGTPAATPSGAPTVGRQGKWSRKRKLRLTATVLVVGLVVVGGGSYAWASSKLNHTNVLADYAGRPPAGKGTNWLILGSDSRQGLSTADQQRLHTGWDTGARTDSMMVLHIGANGDTLMSIPRDSYVTIPAWTDSKGVQHRANKHKINAAFAEGDGPLLVKTIEYNTGLHIDHYAEIGFSGFVNVVDDLGGVDMCLDKAIVDKASGANLKAGCQTLNGTQALAFVRERHQEASQDLARMQHQQQFLNALAHKATSMGTLLNPFTLYPTLNSGLSMLSVDDSTGLTDLSSMFFAMKGLKSGSGKTMTVPISTANYQTPADGVAVKWNMSEAQQVFDAFKNDTKVPTFSN